MSEAVSELNAAMTEVIAFKVHDDEYCVDIMSVREIRGWTPATRIPHAPPYVRGVINLRGAVLPIIDLAARFGFDTTETSERNVIIVAQIDGQLFGLLVDAVSDIMSITADDLQPTPNIGSEQARTFIKNVIAREEQMIRFIDLKQILPQQMANVA
ncbi:chemotaxis protein CheW [Parvularcula sp. ZS-1/3]|uniref:Chemotaxis protein CheW n=1 Tax=Parvularcula mediterranea TaxID=2732508 RepID=A0A7Y3W570_9PROT|nr:chemotaxis protein CheW [Parvularcula mediterranea]NNU16314.1 chemotaxis protein CheW [Parvularcula mediterranea]